MADVQFILTPIPVVEFNFTPTAMIGPYETIIHVVDVQPSTLIEGDFYIILNN